MTSIDFSPIFYPKSVAVIGVSAQPWKWGSIILSNILIGKYRGKVYPVNPKLDSVFGLKVYPNIRDIPDEVDLGIIAVPAAKVPGVLEEFEGKVKASLVITAGFSETEEGGELEKEIVRIAHRTKIPLVGPNTMGVLSSDVRFSALMPQINPRKGVVSFVSQSGNLGTQIAKVGIERGIGINKFIGSGNEADLTLEDYVEYFGQDPKTKVILAYIEGLRKGRRFFEVAKRVTKTKPIVVYKVGYTQAGSKAAKSHTGAITGSDEVYKAMFKQVGVITVSNSEELLDLAAAFSSQPLPKGRRVGILTRGGGWGVVGADACCAAGLEVPSLPKSTFQELNRVLPPYWSKGNPVDTVAAIDPDVHTKCLEILAKCDEFDALIILGAIIAAMRPAMPFPGSLSLIKNFIEGADEDFAHRIVELIHEHGKPIIPAALAVRERSKSVRFLKRKGILIYPTPEKAARVLAYLTEYQERRRKIS